MWLPAGSTSFQRFRRPLFRLGITPLIDIVFLLLIFFMLTSRFIAHEGLEVDLPKTEKPHELKSRESRVIVLLEAGQVIYLGRVVSLREFRLAVSDLEGEELTAPFEIRSSRAASVQTLVTVLEVLREAGASRVRIGTVYEPEQARAMTQKKPSEAAPGADKH